MNNEYKIIPFLFERGIDLFTQHSLGTMMLNLHSIGLSGDYKTDRQENDVVELLVSTSYAPVFAVERKGTRFNFYLLWTDGPKGAGATERERVRKETQLNSGWFFDFVKTLHPKVVIIKTGKRGSSIPGYVKTIKDLEQRIKWHIKRDLLNNKNSKIIRVKSGSVYYAYEIYPEHFTYVTSKLKELNIKYKEVNPTGIA